MYLYVNFKFLLIIQCINDTTRGIQKLCKFMKHAYWLFNEKIWFEPCPCIKYQDNLLHGTKQ